MLSEFHISLSVTKCSGIKATNFVTEVLAKSSGYFVHAMVALVLLDPRKSRFESGKPRSTDAVQLFIFHFFLSFVKFFIAHSSQLRQSLTILNIYFHYLLKSELIRVYYTDDDIINDVISCNYLLTAVLYTQETLSQVGDPKTLLATYCTCTLQ